MVLDSAEKSYQNQKMKSMICLERGNSSYCQKAQFDYQCSCTFDHFNNEGKNYIHYSSDSNFMTNHEVLSLHTNLCTEFEPACCSPPAVFTCIVNKKPAKVPCFQKPSRVSYPKVPYFEKRARLVLLSWLSLRVRTSVWSNETLSGNNSC